MLKGVFRAIAIVALLGPFAADAQTHPASPSARPGGYDAMLASQQSDITLLQRRNAELEADTRNVRAAIDSLRGELLRLRREVGTIEQAQASLQTQSHAVVWALGLAVAVALVSAAAAMLAFRKARQAVRREAAERVFKEWWSEELSGARTYFFNEFLPKHWPHLTDCGVTDLAVRVPEDEGRTRRLCVFFDSVGWQAAMGLVRVEDVIGPMQQSMQRLWHVMKDVIEYERAATQAPTSDPGHLVGFEWLYEWSARPRNRQVHVVKSGRLWWLTGRRVLRREQAKAFRESVEQENAAFFEYCAGLRRVAGTAR
jgi:hypothetical protein